MQEEELPPLNVVDDRKYAKFVEVTPTWDMEYGFGIGAAIKGLSEDGDAMQLPGWLKVYWRTHREAGIVVWLLNILAVGKTRQELEAMGPHDD